MLSLEADSVIDASATWFSPNPAGANGLTAIGEEEAQDTIAYGMPDVLGKERSRYAGKRVAVLGGSAEPVTACKNDVSGSNAAGLSE